MGIRHSIPARRRLAKELTEFLFRSLPSAGAAPEGGPRCAGVPARNKTRCQIISRRRRPSHSGSNMGSDQSSPLRPTRDNMKPWSAETIEFGEVSIFLAFRFEGLMKDPPCYMARARSLFEEFTALRDGSPEEERVFAWLRGACAVPMERYEAYYAYQRTSGDDGTTAAVGHEVAPAAVSPGDRGTLSAMSYNDASSNRTLAGHSARQAFEAKCEALSSALAHLEGIIAENPSIVPFLGVLINTEFVRIGKERKLEDRDRLLPGALGGAYPWGSEQWQLDLCNALHSICRPFIEVEAFVQATSTLCAVAALQADVKRVQAVVSRGGEEAVSIDLQLCGETNDTEVTVDVCVGDLVHSTVQDRLQLKHTPEVVWAGETLHQGSTFEDHGIQVMRMPRSTLSMLLPSSLQDGARLVVLLEPKVLETPREMTAYAADVLHEFFLIFDLDSNGELDLKELQLFLCVLYEIALEKVQQGEDYETAVGPILLFTFPFFRSLPTCNHWG